MRVHVCLYAQALASLVLHYTKLDSPTTSDVLPALLTRLPAALPSLSAQQAGSVLQALQAAGVLAADVAPALIRQASTPRPMDVQEVSAHTHTHIDTRRRIFNSTACICQ